ncbi:MAG TPA: hypothetical protein ENG42_02505, partial [Candidatus Aenigmarchaeota archaeon]|nr:hypothetical protein [Candidatus Aenigmarchaeota archaeon]
HPDTLILYWNGNESYSYSGLFTNITKSNLNDGTYIYYVFVNDTAGNFNTTEARNITVDTTSPTISINSPTTSSPAYRKTGANFTLTYTYSEANPLNLTIYIINSSGAIVFNETNASLVSGTQTLYKNITINLSDGNYTINISIYDAVGHSNVKSEVNALIVDSIAPTLHLFSPLNKTYNTTTVWLNFTFADTYTTTCKYSLDNNANITIPSCSNITLPSENLTEGQHVLNVYVSDLAGNINTTTVTFSIDTQAPNIVLLTGDKAWSASSTFTFYYNVSDANGIKNCSLFISNSTWNNTYWNATPLLNNKINNFTVTVLNSGISENGTYEWYITCYDTPYSHKTTTSLRTLYVGNRSDIMVEGIEWTSSPSPYKGQNISVNVTINNSGTKNVVNDSVVYICVSLKSSSTCINNQKIFVIGKGNLTAGGSYKISLYNLTLANDGDYKIYARADYYNNETMERSDLSGDNNDMTAYFSTYLNVTVLVISNNSVLPGTNLSINLSVKYNNGTYVSGLQKANFSIWDKWNVIGGYRLRNSYLYFVSETNNVYTLSYTVPPVSSYLAEYGKHSIIIGISSNKDTHTRHGNSSVSSYSIKAPELSARLSSVVSQMTVGSTDTITLELKNNGTDTIYNVTVTLATNGTGLKLSKTSCKLDVEWSLGNTSLWKSVSGLCDSVTVTANATGVYKLYVSSAYGNSSTGQRYNARYKASYIVRVVAANQTTGGQQTTVQQQQQQQETEQQTTTTNKYYKIEIIEYNSTISVVQESSVSTNVKVKNAGNYTINANLTILSGVKGISYEVQPLSVLDLNPGNVYIFQYKVVASNESEIGNYTIKLKAMHNATIYDEKTVKLVVLPSNKTKAKINSTIAKYRKLFEELEAKFKNISIKELENEGSYKRANLTYYKIKDLLDRIDKLISEDKYIEANKLLSELGTSIKTFEKQINDVKIKRMEIEKKKAAEFYEFIAILVIVIAIIAFIIYLLLPPKKEAVKESAIMRIKSYLESAKKAPKLKRKAHEYKEHSYMEGYKKIVSAYRYKPKKRKAKGAGIGIVEKIKNLFKKK